MKKLQRWKHAEWQNKNINIWNERKEFRDVNNKYKLTNNDRFWKIFRDRTERHTGVEKSILGFFEGNFSIYNFF